MRENALIAFATVLGTFPIKAMALSEDPAGRLIQAMMAKDADALGAIIATVRASRGQDAAIEGLIGRASGEDLRQALAAVDVLRFSGFVLEPGVCERLRFVMEARFPPEVLQELAFAESHRPAGPSLKAPGQVRLLESAACALLRGGEANGLAWFETIQQRFQGTFLARRIADCKATLSCLP